MTELPMAVPGRIATGQGGTWTYRSIGHRGACKISGDMLLLRLTLEKFTDAVPEVMGVEAWLAELLSVPVIVEEVAVAARLKWGMTATVEGRTARHGPITFRVPA